MQLRRTFRKGIDMNDNNKLISKRFVGAVVALAAVTIVFLLNVISNAIGQSGPDALNDGAHLPTVANEEHGAGASTGLKTELPGQGSQTEDPAITLPEGTVGDDNGADDPQSSDAARHEPAEPAEPIEPDEPDEPAPVSVANLSEHDEELSGELGRIARSFNCVSASLAAFDGASGYFTYQYGFADVGARRNVEEETKFRIASLSKLIVVILAMTLVEEGLLDLDADISDYLGFEAKNPFFPDTPITSRMLMQHTSSIYDTGAFQSGRQAYAADTTRRLLNDSTVHRERQPGTLHEYSDFGYAVLVAVCEEASGKLLDEIAAEALFRPMGIDAAFAPVNLQNKNLATLYNSSHNQSRSVQTQLNHGASGALGHQHNLGIGNLTISALDFTRILVMLTEKGVYSGVRIISEESVREIHNTNVAAEHYRQGLSTRFQANAFMGEGVYWHTGSAYGVFTQFMYCMDTGRAVVAVTTGTRGEREPNGMIKVCLALSEPVWRPS